MSFRIFILLICLICNIIEGCHEGNKDVGVCLHVYLERDFLSLENIVYPSSHPHDRYQRHSGYRESIKLKNGASFEDQELNPSMPEVGKYGRREWIEGPELEDYCVRLKEVLKCFEDVLVECDSGYHFFRYRHLLYALSGAHEFLCATPDRRKNRFLNFLKTIECVEYARVEETSCHRHNVSKVVWNKILRAEIGEEICDSLSTQRSCLIENGYIKKHCHNIEREEIYSNLSNYFLSVWCHYPIHPKLLSMVTVANGVRVININSLLFFSISINYIAMSFFYQILK